MAKVDIFLIEEVKFLDEILTDKAGLGWIIMVWWHVEGTASVSSIEGGVNAEVRNVGDELGFVREGCGDLKRNTTW